MAGGKSPPLSVIKSWPKPNYVTPERYAPTALILSVVLGVISTIVIVGRLWTRFFLIRRPGLDDLFIVIAWIASLGIIAVIFVKDEFDGNRHIWDVRPGNGVKLSIASYAGIFFAIMSLGSIKMSILLFYDRVLTGTTGKRIRWVNNGTIIFIILLSIVFTFLHLLQCRPISAYWLRSSVRPPYSTPYSCVNEGAGTVAYAVLNSSTDIWITLLPLFFLRRLQMPRKQKWALAFLFSIGFIACVAGLARLHPLVKTFFFSYDVTWHANSSWAWVIIEVELGIFCACAPALKPFFSKYLSRPFSRFRLGTSSKYHHQVLGEVDNESSSDSKGLKSVDTDLELQKVTTGADKSRQN